MPKSRRSWRRCSPPARKRCAGRKRLMQAWERLPSDEAIAAGIDAFARAFETDEPKRMLSAFAKRKRD